MDSTGQETFLEYMFEISRDHNGITICGTVLSKCQSRLTLDLTNKLFSTKILTLTNDSIGHYVSYLKFLT